MSTSRRIAIMRPTSTESRIRKELDQIRNKNSPPETVEIFTGDMFFLLQVITNLRLEVEKARKKDGE